MAGALGALTDTDGLTQRADGLDTQGIMPVCRDYGSSMFLEDASDWLTLCCPLEQKEGALRLSMCVWPNDRSHLCY